MRKAIMGVHDKRAGVLIEDNSLGYEFIYDDHYAKSVNVTNRDIESMLMHLQNH